MRYAALLITTVFVAGCQTEPHSMAPPARGEKSSTPKCQAKDTEDSCKILVDITPDPADPTNPRKCAVKVKEAQHVVGFDKNAKGKLIFWEIDSAPAGNYQFTSAGISPKSADARAWDDNFKNGKTDNDGRTFVWKNKNAKSGGGTYEYMVIVVNELGVSCMQDPKIVNQ